MRLRRAWARDELRDARRTTDGRLVDGRADGLELEVAWPGAIVLVRADDPNALRPESLMPFDDLPWTPRGWYYVACGEVGIWTLFRLRHVVGKGERIVNIGTEFRRRETRTCRRPGP